MNGLGAPFQELSAMRQAKNQMQPYEPPMIRILIAALILSLTLPAFARGSRGGSRSHASKGHSYKSAGYTKKSSGRSYGGGGGCGSRGGPGYRKANGKCASW